ncbi:electron transfer flavoprotein subunit alpha/FixB family protein [Consotaella aegiceratis]|uniref:electron transfer flavoprotein subunit alpha/FixB family protein n=1 Tax=Consotaella aegiceratis TaxID=3097961 RepID=UPI002F411991
MSRPRRDPRAEKAARAVSAGGRARFDLALDVASASRRPRRDPRAAFAAARVAGVTRLRIDRAHGVVAPAAAPPFETVTAAAPRIRILETPAFLVFAVLDAPEGRLSRFDRQVLGAARLLADAGNGGGGVVAVVGGEVDGLGVAGADRTLMRETSAAYDPARQSAWLAALIETLKPRHVLLAEDGQSADLARRLSVRLKEPILTDVEHLTVRQAVRACAGGRCEQAGAPPRLMSIGEDRVAGYEGLPCEARALESSIRVEAENGAILSSEIVPGDPATMSLAEADFVVSAGNGVTDFESFAALARALQATPGASRVVCDAGLMPREAQVGASGTVLSADCYFALGIAGAPQHLQGIAGCEHVIAVNTDLHAAMVERASLAIIQDAQEVMPALLRLLEEGK